MSSLMQIIPALPNFRVLFVSGLTEGDDGESQPITDFADVAMWLVINAAGNGACRVVPLVTVADGTYGTMEDATQLHGFVRVLGPSDNPMDYQDEINDVLETLFNADESDDDEDVGGRKSSDSDDEPVN